MTEAERTVTQLLQKVWSLHKAICAENDAEHILYNNALRDSLDPPPPDNLLTRCSRTNQDRFMDKFSYKIVPLKFAADEEDFGILTKRHVTGITDYQHGVQALRKELMEHPERVKPEERGMADRIINDLAEIDKTLPELSVALQALVKERGRTTVAK